MALVLSHLRNLRNIWDLKTSTRSDKSTREVFGERCFMTREFMQKLLDSGEGFTIEYKKKEAIKIVSLYRTGTHSDLFKK